jgi:hypothetical protein
MMSRNYLTFDANNGSLKGAFAYPLLYMRHMEKYYTPKHRRDLYLDSPPWLLLYNTRYHEKAMDFIHGTLTTLVSLEMRVAESPSTFNTETGVVSKHFIDYLRSVEDVDKAIHFADTFRAYLRGERKQMPRNVSHDVESYKHLKNLVKTPYTKKLIGAYKENKASPSQDFVVLFTMPIYALLETIFGSLTDEEVVSTIDSYR